MDPMRCGCDAHRWRRMLSRRQILQASGALAAGSLLSARQIARVLADDATPVARGTARFHFQ